MYISSNSIFSSHFCGERKREDIEGEPFLPKYSILVDRPNNFFYNSIMFLERG